MAESRILAADVKLQATPSFQFFQVVSSIRISDSAPLSVPLRTLSVQQMALDLQGKIPWPIGGISSATKVIGPVIPLE